MNALLPQAHTDIFFRYLGGFFEFICVFSYACFLICIQFLMFFCFVWIGFLLIPAHESLSAEEVICQVIVYRTHDPAFIHHKVGSPSVSKSSLCRNQAINPFCTDKYSSQAKRILVLEKSENRSAKFKPVYKNRI